MAVFKLHLDEFDEVDYELIAIHSSIEDYRMAYFLNQNLPIILSKSKQYISVNSKEGEVFFSKFTFDDLKNDLQWSLLQNKNEIITSKSIPNPNLFSNIIIEVETNVFLIPELKKVDYFLKIENTNANFDLHTILKKIHTITKITTAYAVDPEKIKSKNNLIF
ncbi:MAG TPA: IPExxxVDY family protein [Flavobacterium sp.]|jgi:hypothetical protein